MKKTCLVVLASCVVVLTFHNKLPATPGADSESTNTAVIPVPRVGKEAGWTAIFNTKLRSAEKINRASPIQVIFDGDSITALFESRAPDIWRVYQTKYHAFDFAISGDSTEQVLCRLDRGQAKGMHPQLIFLMIGHNNIMHNTPEQIFEGVAAIIKKYQEVCPDSLIVLQATFPSKEPKSKWRTSIAALDKLLPKLAEPGKVIYVDFGEKFLSPDGTISKEVMPDGTHPALQGYEIWAAAIQPILNQYYSSVSGNSQNKN